MNATTTPTARPIKINLRMKTPPREIRPPSERTAYTLVRITSTAVACLVAVRARHRSLMSGGRCSVRYQRRAHQFEGPLCQFDQHSDYFGDDPLMTWLDVLAEVPDPWCRPGGSSIWTPLPEGRLTGFSGWNPSRTRSSATW